MKRYSSFGEYMFSLLIAPLKKGEEAVNQFRIFFRVVGRQFDAMKEDIFAVRDEANVASCSPVMLPIHGADRDMPRLPGEDLEAYRTRLAMKGVIAQWSGTKKGVLYALTALGYDKSEIELMSLQDHDKWAEFLIYLDGSKHSGINDLAVIDAQVQKVKEASSKPSYGTKSNCDIVIDTEIRARVSWYPRCGETVSGVYPYPVSMGHMATETLRVEAIPYNEVIQFPKAATVAASERFYQLRPGAEFDAFYGELQTNAHAVDGDSEYEKCSPLTYAKGGSE